jgi:hypothetical protein
MSKIKIKWISRTIVESPFSIGLCLSEKIFNNELKRLKVPRDNWPQFVSTGSQATVHMFQKNNSHDQCIIICMKDFKDKPIASVIGLLIHESVHVWQRICEIINEDSPSSEFEAYAIQELSQRLIVAYEKMSKKLR